MFIKGLVILVLLSVLVNIGLAVIMVNQRIEMINSSIIDTSEIVRVNDFIVEHQIGNGSLIKKLPEKGKWEIVLRLNVKDEIRKK